MSGKSVEDMLEGRVCELREISGRTASSTGSDGGSKLADEYRCGDVSNTGQRPRRHSTIEMPPSIDVVFDDPICKLCDQTKTFLFDVFTGIERLKQTRIGVLSGLDIIDELFKRNAGFSLAKMFAKQK